MHDLINQNYTDVLNILINRCIWITKYCAYDKSNVYRLYAKITSIKNKYDKSVRYTLKLYCDTPNVRKKDYIDLNLNDILTLIHTGKLFADRMSYNTRGFVSLELDEDK